MTVSQIILLIVALFLFIVMCILMYALFMAQCESLARLAIKVRNHTKR